MYLIQKRQNKTLHVFINKNYSISSPKCAECSELRDQLKELQEVLQRLKDENASLRKENETLQRNGSSLLVTARCEVQRKDDQIIELRKE